MFFVFLISLLTIYVSETNNSIIKKESLDGSYNVYHSDKDLIFQNDRNVLSSLPTPKSIIPKTQEFLNRIKSNPSMKNFGNKEPDEVLVKRHIKGNDLHTSSFFKSTKTTLSSTPQKKRKLPAVEFGSDSDDLNEYLNYFDEIEKKPLPVFHEIENARKSKNDPRNLENLYLYQQNNHSEHSKDNVFDLKSLPSKHCQSCEQCVCPNTKNTGKAPGIGNVHDCTRKPEYTSTTNFYPPYNIHNTPTNNPPGPQSTTVRQVTSGYNFPMGIGYPMGIPFGMPAGYAGGIPIGVPANVPIGYAQGVPQSYYQDNNFKEATTYNKPCRNPNHLLYYNDDDDTGKIYVDKDDDYKKRKRKHKGEVFVNIEYDVEETKKPIQKPFNRNNPDILENDIFKDAKKSCDDTIIKKCFCCSSSSLDINNLNFESIFILSIFVIV
ncbi:hypothetical protein HF086_018072, partial [Spodoptera exigua]